MNLEEKVKERLKGKRAAVLGVGSVLKADDAAGMYVAQKLSERISNENVLILQGSTAPENMTGVIKEFQPDTLLIIDAAYMGQKPGDIRIIEDDEIDGLSFSTHMLPMSVMLNYLRLYIRCEVICIGIEPESTELGEEMCDSVTKAANELTDVLYNSINIICRL